MQVLDQLGKDVIVHGALRRTVVFCKTWAKSAVTGRQVAALDLAGNVKGLDLSLEFFGLCRICVIIVDHDVAELRQVDLA